MSEEHRIVYLEVNDSGGWRRVTSFDLGWFKDGDLEHHAQALLELTSNPRLKARIIMPGDGAPLLNWTHAEGWREWVHPGSRTPAQGTMT